MRVKLIKLWQTLRSSYWFVPSIMAVSAIFLSWFMTALDTRLDSEGLTGLFFIYLNQPDGARSLLSTVAGSMITVAGVTFSITMVVLSLASQQFGPRLLRNFMRDTGNQVVLGTFIATFLYCLLVLRTVRTMTDANFVPHLAILLAVVLTILSLGVFIYFIHHTAESIQISTVLGLLARELKTTIETQYLAKHIFPEQLGQGSHEKQKSRADWLEPFEANVLHINAPRSGYLQAVDYENLINLAKSNNIVIELNHYPGHFVYENKSFLSIHYRNLETLSDSLKTQLFNCFAFGMYRTHAQDIQFLFDQITEVAARALSPGINDPFTARSCIEQSTAGFLNLLERDLPSMYRLEDDELRVIAPTVKLESLFVACFNPIRHYGKDSFLVNQSLLESYSLIKESSYDEALTNRINIEAKQLIEDSCAVLSQAECNDLAQLYTSFKEDLNQAIETS